MVHVAYIPLSHSPQAFYNSTNRGGSSMDKEYLLLFGKRIRELRQKTGLSQEKFALMIDMDRSYYSSIESGKRNVSLLNIKKIADGLGLTLEKLFSNL